MNEWSLEKYSRFLINGLVTCWDYKKVTPQRWKLNFWPWYLCWMVPDTCWSYLCLIFWPQLLSEMTHVWKVVLIRSHLYHFLLLLSSQLHLNVLLNWLDQTVFVEHVHFWDLYINCWFPHLLPCENWHVLLFQQSSHSHWRAFIWLQLLRWMRPLSGIELLQFQWWELNLLALFWK